MPTRSLLALAVLVLAAIALFWPTPRPASAAGFKAVGAGGHHACALRSGGGVKCWGANDHGESGDGTTTDRTSRVGVQGLTSGFQAGSADATFPGANGKIVFNGVRPAAPGDATCDFTVDARDAALILQVVAGLFSEGSLEPCPDLPFRMPYPRILDNDGDGRVTSVDALLVLQVTVGVLDTDEEIFTIDPDGGGVAQLTDDPALDYAPSWSPDGTKVAFFHFTIDLELDIYAMGADGSGRTKLTDASQAPSIFDDLAWSPDGEKIAFTSWSAANDMETIYVISSDGTGLTELTVGSDPAWSPDGTRIAFTALGDPGGGDGICVMNADGTGESRLTNGFGPVWSPNGTMIAFTAREDSGGGFGIYVINADGKGQRRLADGGDPDWSPDGMRLAFSGGESPNIYVMNADGSSRIRLTGMQGRWEKPAWSPDGTRIAYVKHESQFPQREFFMIYVMDADGGNATPLVPSVSGPLLHLDSSVDLDWQVLSAGP